MRKNHKTPFSHLKELMKRDVRNKYILTAFCVVLIITCFCLIDSPIEDKVFTLLNALGIGGYWARCVYFIFEAVVFYTELVIAAWIESEATAYERWVQDCGMQMLFGGRGDSVSERLLRHTISVQPSVHCAQWMISRIA